MSNSNLEIERVWILDGVPDIPQGAECWHIRQGYLAEPGANDIPEKDPEVVPSVGRIRSIKSIDGLKQFVHTIKHGLGLVRKELEVPITEAAFEAAWEQTKGRRLAKTRWRVPDGVHTWEVDQFEGLDLVLVEVELGNAEEAVEVPSWLAQRIVREVTEEPEYRNVEIAARLGLLEE